MKWSICVLMVVSLTSCAVRKEKTTEKQLLKVGYKVSRNTASDLKSYTHYSDSTQTLLELAIEPQGYFRYSINEGFEGEAKRVLLRETKLAKKQGDMHSEFKKAETLNSSHHKLDEQQHIDKLVSRNYQSDWCWIALVAIVLLIWLNYPSLRRFWKNIFKTDRVF